MSVMTEMELARFVDRWTMEHVRVYPHPVQRVWRAITDPEHIRKWFTEADIELRVGGTARFGPTDNPWFTSTVSALDPPRLIQFTNALPSGRPGYDRYELFEVEGGCRMVFTQHFEPGDRFDAVPEDLGGDLPGGPDTPWAPGFVGGWHDFFDRLGRALDGRPLTDPSDTLFAKLAAHALERLVEDGVIPSDLAARTLDEFWGTERWNELNEIYRTYIRENIPPA